MFEQLTSKTGIPVQCWAFFSEAFIEAPAPQGQQQNQNYDDSADYDFNVEYGIYLGGIDLMRDDRAHRIGRKASTCVSTYYRRRRYY